MKTVYSDRHRLQDGQSELIDGKLVKCFECPERADLVLARVRDRGIGDVLEPTSHGLDPVRRVHTPAFVDFLSTAWDEWVAAHGAYDALPITWPTRGLRQDRIPDAIDGKLSYFSLDAGTPITSGTWSAITAAADVALTGVDLVLGGENMERFTRFPKGARARDTYLQGNHVYGKIALMHPLNFECLDVIPRAVAPNIGYLAQTFVVDDLAATLALAAGVGAEVFSAPVEMQLPGHGRVATAIVRNPGSGALHELIQRL